VSRGYTIHVNVPLCAAAGGELDTLTHTLVLSDPPTPVAEFGVTITAYGRELRFELLVPTVDEHGDPLPDETQITFDLEAVAIAPDEVEVAEVKSDHGRRTTVRRSIYRGGSKQ
jgi:hypothetical protein